MRHRIWFVCSIALTSSLLVLAQRGQAREDQRPSTLLRAPRAEVEGRYATWRHYGGTPESMQYSSLTQINKTNVSRLELVWHYPVPDRTGNFGFNPIVVDNVMYVLGPSRTIVALDAATGSVVWSHSIEGEASAADRGVTYWESQDRSDRRLLFAAGGTLRALDARTGRTIPTFGDEGRVVFRVGYPRVLGSTSGTPGRVFQNLYIAGSNTGEGYFSAPGDIRAFDVVTGKLVWTFHTIPRPGEFGYETWPPDAWKYAGGANNWGEMSLDERRGIVYIPLGSPTHDMFGGDRKGANLFGNSLVALDARTGTRHWHFQTIHHDLWDYDLTTAPKLLTVRHEGKLVDIVAQPTKHGLLFVFDRVTGKPIWPIEERPAPRSDVPGEEAWPTQPFPTKPPPYGRLSFGAHQINPYLDPEETESVRQRFLAARNEGLFTPVTLDRETIAIPGQFGGSNWSGSAADPRTGMLYVRNLTHPTIHQLREFNPNEPPQGGPPEVRGRGIYEQKCSSCHGEPEPGGIRTPDGAAMIAVRKMGAERLRAVLREGLGQMPAFTEELLSSEDLRALLAFLGNPAVGGPGPDVKRANADDKSPRPLSPKEEGLAAYSGRRYTGPLGRAFTAKNGMSAISPPWSEIVAYDLNQGTIAWRAPFGNHPALAARGIKNTGNARRAWRNGPVVTAGGLIFVGTWADRAMRALDKDNGKVLWEYELKANPEGIVSVFEVDGRQYVAICAAGAEDKETPADQAFEQWTGLKSAQGYYVFALPRTTTSSLAK